MALEWHTLFLYDNSTVLCWQMSLFIYEHRRFVLSIALLVLNKLWHTLTAKKYSPSSRKTLLTLGRSLNGGAIGDILCVCVVESGKSGGCRHCGFS